MHPLRVMKGAASGIALSAFAVFTFAELDVVEVRPCGNGTVDIVIEDTEPPHPYVIEKRDFDAVETPWEPVPWGTLECARPARFVLNVPGQTAESDFYRVSTAAGHDAPLVIATNPAQGVAAVSPSRKVVGISFDRPMRTSVAVEADPVWGASWAAWSEDRRTVWLHRINGNAPLPANTRIVLNLNPMGAGFEDAMGHVLAPCTLSFTTGADPVAGPHVVETVPASGATGIDPFVEQVEFHFSEPMMPTGAFLNSGWWPWELSWSEDGLIAYVRRGDAGTPLFGREIMLSPLSFHAVDGRPMIAAFTLRFSTAPAWTERVEAQPELGFFWPYLLFIPPRIEAPVTLLVEPNNTGTWADDPWQHEQAAQMLVQRRAAFATALGCPLMVPVLPRPQNPQAPEPGGIYIHALDRYSLSQEWPGIERIDLQLEAMIDDALHRLRSDEHEMRDRVFMMGFSASGAFTSRFCVLHPDRIQAAAQGSPGGWPTAPVDSWEGTPLPYPTGVGAVSSLTGRAFDLEEFRQIPLYIYVGDADRNDALDLRGIEPDEADLIRRLLDIPDDPLIADRWPLARSIYQSVGANASFVVYPGVGHTITSEMFDDLSAFFSAHR